jgi:hypothetical protein
MPHWLTTAITCLLPESEYTKEPNNYRPILFINYVQDVDRDNFQNYHIWKNSLLPADFKDVTLEVKDAMFSY